MSASSSSRTARQVRYLERLAAAKQRLLRSIAGLDDTVLCSEPVVGHWSVKDILGHVVSWNREFRADIRLIRRGRHPGYERRISGADDFNEWNQHWIARKRGWSWRRVRADLERDYQEAVELILRLEPHDFRRRGVTPWKRAAAAKPAAPATADTDSIGTLVTFHWRHSDQHARMIERWRKRRARSHD